MSAFTNGFNIGFVSGMFNGMFGGFAPFGGCMPFGGFNPFCCNFFGGFNFMPSFFTPMFNTSVFGAYSAPSANMSFQNFSMPAVNNNFDWGSFDTGNAWSSFHMGDSFVPSAPMNNRSYSDTDTSNISYDAEVLKNKWKNKKPGLSNAFYNKVVDIAKKINCDPNDLMALMNSESRINSKAVNKNTKATGLIQFMPTTAIDLGTTVEQLVAMTPEQQLGYVEKYLVKAKKGAGLGNQKLDAGTLYALTFLPAFAKTEVLTKRGEIYYSWNPAFDANKDGRITKTELAARIRAHRV